LYIITKIKLGLGFRFMVFNTTFNNNSVILWRSVLLEEETLSHNQMLFIVQLA